MTRLSTREAAKKLGIDHSTLANYVMVGKIPRPEAVSVGSRTIHLWTDEHIERVRQLLPKIKNGRKTRHQKKQALKAKLTTKKEPRPGAAVPHTKSKP